MEVEGPNGLLLINNIAYHYNLWPPASRWSGAGKLMYRKRRSSRLGRRHVRCWARCSTARTWRESMPVASCSQFTGKSASHTTFEAAVSRGVLPLRIFPVSNGYSVTLCVISVCLVQRCYTGRTSARGKKVLKLWANTVRASRVTSEAGCQSRPLHP